VLGKGVAASAEVGSPMELSDLCIEERGTPAGPARRSAASPRPASSPAVLSTARRWRRPRAPAGQRNAPVLTTFLRGLPRAELGRGAFFGLVDITALASPYDRADGPYERPLRPGPPSPPSIG